LDLPHSFDTVLKLGDADKDKALVKAPWQVENLREGEQLGVALRLDLLELAAFASQAAIVKWIMNLAAPFALVGD
jgi:hypothetical protein